MRGKLGVRQILAPATRNIPAYAGKTGDYAPGKDTITEHPRVCGENKALAKKLADATGTSPRMRGKLSRNNELRIDPRNIPAYAGKTRWPCAEGHRPTEHPRVCGENLRRI